MKKKKVIFISLVVLHAISIFGFNFRKDVFFIIFVGLTTAAYPSFVGYHFWKDMRSIEEEIKRRIERKSV